VPFGIPFVNLGSATAVVGGPIVEKQCILQLDNIILPLCEMQLANEYQNMVPDKRDIEAENKVFDSPQKCNQYPGGDGGKARTWISPDYGKR